LIKRRLIKDISLRLRILLNEGKGIRKEEKYTLRSYDKWPVLAFGA
jgi:hypothetical protein